MDEILVAGLATDYCVRSTALDGLKLGYRVHVVEDGCRGVELNAGDVAPAVEEMRSAGARVVRSGDLE